MTLFACYVIQMNSIYSNNFLTSLHSFVARSFRHLHSESFGVVHKFSKKHVNLIVQ